MYKQSVRRDKQLPKGHVYAHVKFTTLELGPVTYIAKILHKKQLCWLVGGGVLGNFSHAFGALTQKVDVWQMGAWRKFTEGDKFPNNEKKLGAPKTKRLFVGAPAF